MIPRNLDICSTWDRRNHLPESAGTSARPSSREGGLDEGSGSADNSKEREYTHGSGGGMEEQGMKTRGEPLQPVGEHENRRQSPHARLGADEYITPGALSPN